MHKSDGKSFRAVGRDFVAPKFIGYFNGIEKMVPQSLPGLPPDFCHASLEL
jgi:hypothetical protein